MIPKKTARPSDHAFERALFVRRTLVGAGYLPVPVEHRGKAPWMVGWQSYCHDPSQLTQWAWSRRSKQTGEWEAAWCVSTGVRCEQLVAIDVDIDDDEMCEHAVAILSAHLGATPVVRMRQRTCRRVLFYGKGGDLPDFKRTLKLAAGQVEVMAPGRSQVVVHGEHPTSTDAESVAYYFEHAALWEVPRTALPCVGRTELDAAASALAHAYPPPEGAQHALRPVTSEDAAAQRIIDGVDLHDSIVRIAGHRARRGQPMDFCLDDLRWLLAHSLRRSTDPATWAERFDDLQRCVADIYRKEARDPDSLAAQFAEYILHGQPPKLREPAEINAAFDRTAARGRRIRS